MRAFRELTAERLFEAAEAAIAGAVAVSRQTGRTCPYPTDLVGTALEPEAFRGFARWELEEACSFLVRLGVFHRTTESGSAGE